MLGLADRTKLINLFKEILLGDQKKSIFQLRELINNGLDSKNFLNDILEILYLFSRRSNLGPIEKDSMISESEISLIDQYSKNLDMQDLGLFWQLTIKTLEDLKIVANDNLTLEMYVMQLIHLKNIDKIEETINNKNKDKNELLELNKNIKSESTNDNKNTQITDQLKSTEQIKKNIIKNPELKAKNNLKSNITNFQELIDLANNEKEVELKYDLERNVKLVSFSRGKIDISFNEKLNKKFIKVLTEKLLAWTGERWIISLSKNEGVKSLHEQILEKKILNLKNEKNSEVVKNFLSVFQDADLINVEVEKDD
jgi:DNA polymerase-3 subunit gamma/tau